MYYMVIAMTFYFKNVSKIPHLRQKFVILGVGKVNTLVILK